MRLLALIYGLLLGMAILGCSREEPEVNPKLTGEGGKNGSSFAHSDQADKPKRQVKPPLGKVVAQPHIAKAQLVPKTQPLNLEFVKTLAVGVAGTYKVQNVTLLANNESPERGGISGVFSENSPEMTIRPDQSTPLIAGEPLDVQVQYVAKEADGTIEFSISITGIGGEIYTWRQKNQFTPKAGFEILDESGKQIASETFEFELGSSCPRSWRAPSDLSGTFRLIPKIDMSGYEHKIVERTICFKNGLLVEEEKRAVESEQ
jgi:hypothetical protein